MIYLSLFYEFFKTGLFAIGGGMATIPFLYDIADKTDWFTRTDLANMIAVSESTPGPIGVNMATYVGYLTGMGEHGVVGAIIGAVVATLGLITPSIIMILIVAAVLKSFRDNKYVNNAFYGLRPASTGLIAAAGISVIMSNLFIGEVVALNSLNIKGIILGLILFVLTNFIKPTKKLHPIVFIALSAAAGMIFSM
ncbi:MAG: chromate transporter [Oscillospiraceae bacterium]|nr:chromate transporter [Oscillospiraceae bacterium]